MPTKIEQEKNQSSQLAFRVKRWRQKVISSVTLWVILSLLLVFTGLFLDSLPAHYVRFFGESGHWIAFSVVIAVGFCSVVFSALINRQKITSITSKKE